MRRWVKVWIDGGVRSQNPSPRGVYWSVHVERNGEAIRAVDRHANTRYTTNNEAEWLALESALTWLYQHCPKEPAVIYSDSKLIVGQFTGRFAVVDQRMKKLAERCRKLSAALKFVVMQWRPREELLEKVGH